MNIMYGENEDLEMMRDRNSREYILHNATLSDYMGLISDQINDPFDTATGINYLKKIRKLVPDDNKMDEYCCEVLDMIIYVIQLSMYFISIDYQAIIQLFIQLYLSSN